MKKYDNSWKGITEQCFQEFVAFFLPQAYHEIAWEHSFDTLSTELENLGAKDVVGTRFADKLFRVCLRTGENCLVLVHLEFQNQVCRDFPERMYIYNNRLFNKYRLDIISVAILGDEVAHWRPNRFHRGRWGCHMSLVYPVIKLIDYRNDKSLASGNQVFGLVTHCYLEALRTNRNPEQRLSVKTQVVRSLLKKKFTRKQIHGLLRFIDIALDLPDEMQLRFVSSICVVEDTVELQEWLSFELPMVTAWKQLALEEARRKGIAEGKAEGIAEGKAEGIAEGSRGTAQAVLEARYGTLPDWALAKLAGADIGQLNFWAQRCFKTEGLRSLLDTSVQIVAEQPAQIDRARS